MTGSVFGVGVGVVLTGERRLLAAEVMRAMTDKMIINKIIIIKTMIFGFFGSLFLVSAEILVAGMIGLS